MGVKMRNTNLCNNTKMFFLNMVILCKLTIVHELFVAL